MILEKLSLTETPETVWEKGYETRKPQRYLAGRRESTLPVIIVIRNPHAVSCLTEQSCHITVDYKEAEGQMQLEDSETTYSDILDTSTKMPLMGVELLEDKYVIDSKPEISTFLDENPELISALIEIYDQINNIFDKNIIEVCLSLNKDLDEDYTGLSVVIRTTLKSGDSLALLDEFDDEYWLDLGSDIRNIVTVIVRSV
ncbi:MAG: hypothetical protein V1693_04130 [Nanoarchaeota archaeon]